MSSSNLPDIEVEKSLHLDLSNVEVQDMLQSREYIYQCNTYSEFAVTFSESIIFARQIAVTLIKKAQATAEAKQMARDIPIHSANFAQEIAFSLSILCSNHQYTNKDYCFIEEDIEPEAVLEDAWRRNNTNIKVKPTSPTTEPSKFQKESNRHHSRESALEKQQTKVEKHDKDPLPVPLIEEHDDDDYQDKLRNVKLYEQKKKQEAEIKKHTEKAKVLKPDRNDTGPKKYTFDFDGTIIPSKGVKVEKLCPPNYLINFSVQDSNKNVTQETQATIKTKKGKQKQESLTEVIPSQKVFNKILEERKDQVRDSLGDKAIKANSIIQFPYENFNMNSGVKLVFESKMKECARLQIRDSVETLTYKLSGGNQVHSPRHAETQPQDTLRLTRTEYFLLTQHGNIQMQNQTHKDDKQTHHSIVSSSKQKLKVDAPTQEQNQEIYLMNTKKQNTSLQKASTISIKNNKQIQKLIEEEDTPLQKIYKIKAGKIKPTPAIDEKPKNPLDQFNQTLLQSKDWGKQGGQSYLPPIKQQKADQEQYRASLEQQYKKPRERLTDQDARTQTKFFDQKNITKNLKKLQKLENFQTFYTTHSKFNEILRNN